jgi:hypothetical protein
MKRNFLFRTIDDTGASEISYADTVEEARTMAEDFKRSGRYMEIQTFQLVKSEQRTVVWNNEPIGAPE